MMTSLGMASDGLLDRGDYPSRHMASMGLLRTVMGTPNHPNKGGSGGGRRALQYIEPVIDPTEENNRIIMMCIEAFMEARS
jgi:hypothetical protein